MKLLTKVALVAALFGTGYLSLTQAGSVERSSRNQQQARGKAVLGPEAAPFFDPARPVVLHVLTADGGMDRVVEGPRKSYLVVPYPGDERPKTDMERKLREQVSATLEQAQPIPPARLAHFSQLLNAPLNFHGWQAMIDDVSATPGGWTAQIRFTPNVTSAAGNSATVLGGFVEHYTFDNGSLHFIQGAGLAGYDGGGSFIVD